MVNEVEKTIRLLLLQSNTFTKALKAARFKSLTACVLYRINSPEHMDLLGLLGNKKCAVLSRCQTSHYRRNQQYSGASVHFEAGRTVNIIKAISAANYILVSSKIRKVATTNNLLKARADHLAL
jgi:hypothetical protein